MCRLIKSCFLAAFILLSICSISLAQETLPSKEEIGKVENRGREIANYEKAAIRATDLLLASKPDRSKLGFYLAVKQKNDWLVYFGKNTNKGFDTQYIYSCPEGRFNEMRKLNKSEIEKDIKQIFPENIYQLAKAIDIAFKSISEDLIFPRYNTNVFREKDGTITVYLTPGNEDQKIIGILGGDFRISVSKDASEVIKKNKLHASYLKLTTPPKDVAGSYETHVLGDLPTETDVAFIILNPVLAPHFITGKTWMSKIEADGKITVLGKTEEVLKDREK
jgi:hypothetical protein